MSDLLTPQKIQEWTRVGVLVSLSLVFSYLETFIIIPIPGVRLGLANVVIITALKLLPLPQAAGIAALKVLISGLLFGSPLTIAYALLGTVLSFLLMAVLMKTTRVHIVAISICGALFHTAGQLFVAELLLETAAVWVWSPFLALTSILAGALTGLIAQQTLRAFDATHAQVSFFTDDDLHDVAAQVVTKLQSNASENVVPTLIKLGILVVFIALLFQTRNLTLMGIFTVLTLICAHHVHLPFDSVKRVLPLCILCGLTALMQVLSGKDVFYVLVTILRFMCTVIACASFAQITPLTELHALITRTLKPLAQRSSSLAETAAGLSLALTVALIFIPLQRQLFDTLRKEQRPSIKLLPDLMSSSLVCTDQLAAQLLAQSNDLLSSDSL